LVFFLTRSGSRGVFLPQIMPQDFVSKHRDAIIARPREFLAMPGIW